MYLSMIKNFIFYIEFKFVNKVTNKIIKILRISFIAIVILNCNFNIGKI